MKKKLKIIEIHPHKLKIYGFSFKKYINEEQIIINTIIPFCIKKYYDLSKWAKKKVFIECAPLQELKFEKFDNEWKLIFIASGWSSNEANIIIQYILPKSIKDKCLENNINLTYVSYASASSISSLAIKYIVYDIVNKKILEQK